MSKKMKLIKQHKAYLSSVDIKVDFESALTSQAQDLFQREYGD